MKGILFKPDLIKAIVEGRKTVTRRLMQNQPVEMDKVYYKDFRKDAGGRKPRYRVGETVYIKEAWWEDSGDIYYKSDFPHKDFGDIPMAMYFEKGKWKSPLFLPEIFARYFIQILDVRPKRLHEIENETDGFKKEGYAPLIGGKSAMNGKPFEMSMDFAWYEALWDSINPKYPFASNPFIWRYEFKLIPERSK